MVVGMAGPMGMAVAVRMTVRMTGPVGMACRMIVAVRMGMAPRMPVPATAGARGPGIVPAVARVKIIRHTPTVGQDACVSHT